ncbi:hypothetical protein GF318_03640 [Candidatus Micrarchaeota archaeon]|nr:hypothetical protein [Candidatus Micrarchaeota archaeon]
MKLNLCKVRERKEEKKNDAEKAGVWDRMKRHASRLAAAVAVTITVGAGFGCSGVARRSLECDGGVCPDRDAAADADTGQDGDTGDAGPVLPERSFANLVGDYLNRSLLDRTDNGFGNPEAEYAMGGSDTSENANPFTDGMGGSIGPSEAFLNRTDDALFEPLATRVVTDDVTGHSYAERQYIYVRGDNHYESSVADVVGRLDFLAYALKFDGPEENESGIAVCTHGLGAGGACGLPGYTGPESRRREIFFLGEPWIITEMNPPDVELADENRVVNGGMIKLAKESTSAILGVSESLIAEGLEFRLWGIEEHGGCGLQLLTLSMQKAKQYKETV